LGRFFLRGLAPSGQNLALAPLEMISDVRCVDRHEEYFRTLNLYCERPVVRLAMASTIDSNQPVSYTVSRLLGQHYQREFGGYSGPEPFG
jgi:hypothetical protein